jgi:lysozyme
MGVYTGVDVSQFQGTIDWNALAQSVSFVIYRGTSAQGGLHVDPNFLTNHAQARAHNIPHGIYHFAGSTDPVDEANYFYQQCATNLQPGEVVILDAEWNLATSPAWCLTFLQNLELLVGFKPMIYMNHALMLSQDWSAVSGANYGLWLADWDGDPNTIVTMHDWTFCAIQQYSDTGNIAGLNPVDVDAFFASSMEVWNSYGKPQPAPIPVLQPAPVVVPVTTPTTTTKPVVINDPVMPVKPKAAPVKVTPTPAPVAQTTTYIRDMNRAEEIWYDLPKSVRYVIHAGWQIVVGTVLAHWTVPHSTEDMKALVTGTYAATLAALKVYLVGL